jgi:hypothetical protein
MTEPTYEERWSHYADCCPYCCTHLTDADIARDIDAALEDGFGPDECDAPIRDENADPIRRHDEGNDDR